MSQRRFLGIDGGGSKTAFCLIDEEGTIRKTITLGPSSIDSNPLPASASCLKEGVEQMGEPLDAVFAGIGGIATKEDRELVSSWIKECPNAEKAKVSAGNDVENAHAGALNGKDGIVLIAGTGSVAYGTKGDKRWRCGGYGYRAGDPGSSFAIGHMALRHLARYYDGREEKDPLDEEIASACHVHDVGELAHYFTSASRTEIAALSKTVTSLDSPLALKILKVQAEAAAEMVETVYRKLSFTTCPFSIIGGLGNAVTPYQATLLSRLKTNCPDLSFAPKEKEAYYGSALLAKKLWELNSVCP